MKPLIVMLLLLLVLPISSRAQTLKELSNRPVQVVQVQVNRETPQERKDREALNTASWVYIATAAADWSVTAVCAKVLCFDSTQTGLFLNGIENEHIAIPLGLAIDAGLLYAIREGVAPDHPKLARGLLYVLSAARGVVVVAKVNDLRDHARRTLP